MNGGQAGLVMQEWSCRIGHEWEAGRVRRQGCKPHCVGGCRHPIGKTGVLRNCWGCTARRSVAGARCPAGWACSASSRHVVGRAVHQAATLLPPPPPPPAAARTPRHRRRCSTTPRKAAPCSRWGRRATLVLGAAAGSGQRAAGGALCAGAGGPPWSSMLLRSAGCSRRCRARRGLRSQLQWWPATTPLPLFPGLQGPVRGVCDPVRPPGPQYGHLLPAGKPPPPPLPPCCCPAVAAAAVAAFLPLMRARCLPQPKQLLQPRCAPASAAAGGAHVLPVPLCHQACCGRPRLPPSPARRPHLQPLCPAPLPAAARLAVLHHGVLQGRRRASHALLSVSAGAAADAALAQSLRRGLAPAGPAGSLACYVVPSRAGCAGRCRPRGCPAKPVCPACPAEPLAAPRNARGAERPCPQGRCFCFGSHPYGCPCPTCPLVPNALLCMLTLYAHPAPTLHVAPHARASAARHIPDCIYRPLLARRCAF